ncbi:hypothetical protein V8C86DRAFT_2473181, partial [Haematococcus lacustris]
LRQKVLVLVGVPGSGKSTIAQELREAGWVVVNQDVLGSRRSCEAAFDEALQAGRNVVVDRCNFDEAQRSTWVQLSLEYSSSLSTQAAWGIADRAGAGSAPGAVHPACQAAPGAPHTAAQHGQRGGGENGQPMAGGWRPVMDGS